MARVVRVGVGVFVRRPQDGFCLFGLRQGSHGERTWGLPGGSLEFGEDVCECACREVREEAGLEICDLRRLLDYTEDYFPSDLKHYITLFVEGTLKDSTQEPEILEPKKCLEWAWRPFDQPPTPVFSPLQRYLDQLKR